MSKKISLEFGVEEVDAILGALGNEPFVKVADLINNIRTQAVPQWQAMNAPQEVVLDAEE
jgi:hypothetical protein